MVDGPTVKRINVNLDARLHDQFKAASAAQGKNMTAVLIEFIKNYVRTAAPPSREEQ